MLITRDYIDPVELTGYVRPRFADLQQNRFTLSAYLPNENIDDLEWRVNRRSGPGFADTAEFRAWDTESGLAARKGFQRISGELPPISQKIRLGEFDSLRTRRDPDALFRDAILDDLDTLVENVSARMELARSEVLFNGSFNLNENGVSLAYDAGRRNDHTVTADALWSDSNSDPLADLLKWRQLMIDHNGGPPGVMLMSTRIRSLLQQNAAIRNMLFPGTASRQPSIVSQDAVSQLFNAYGLPTIAVYDAQVAGPSGAGVRVTPDNKILFLPESPAQFGRTFWGTTAESLEAEYGLEGSLPGLVAGNYSDIDPVALWTKVAAIGMPVLINPDLSMVATVL